MGTHCTTSSPHQLLQYFEALSETPDAVPKLRAFVLDLAIRGRLVPRAEKPDSDPAWLEFPTKLDNATQGQGEKAPLPFVVPAHWRWACLSEIADCRAAAKVAPSEISDNDWVLDLEDIDGKTGKVVTTAKFAERRSLSTKAAFQTDDVLYGKLRPYLNKVVVADRPGFCTTEIIPLRPAKFLTSQYLRFFLRSPHFVHYAESMSYGMKMPRLGTDDLEEAQVAVPPPEEQRRIVAKAEELLTLCDELEARQAAGLERRIRLVHSALDHLTAAKDEISLQKHSSFILSNSSLLLEDAVRVRQMIASLAVQGRLVPQDPSDEPAGSLLTRIKQAHIPRSGQTGRTQKALPQPVLENHIPWAAPAGWIWTRLSGIFRTITDGDHLPPPQADRGAAFLTISNITTGRLDFSNCRFVQQNYLRSLAAYRRPRYGDILYTVVGATYGRPALVNTHREFCVQRHIAILKPFPDLDVRFLYLLLGSPLVYAQATQGTTGTAQPTVPLGALRNFVVPLPPLAEQHRIVAKAKELTRLCDDLANHLTAARSAGTHLLESALRQIVEPDQ